jgi:DNA invertase Pin-like site-specific DNA recombinase
MGAVRRVYVYRLDRLTRSGIRDTSEVIEELRAHGCTLVSVSDGFDLEGPAAEIVLAVMAWASKMERLAINERISAARDRVEAEGGRWGRPTRVDAELHARMLKVRRAGRSVREIAVALKVPRTNVARHLVLE